MVEHLTQDVAGGGPCGLGVADALALDVDLSSYLRRHHCGDWGEELCAEDKQANEDALIHGTRLLSCYRTPAGARLYIITEHDRSISTILLPEEY